MNSIRKSAIFGAALLAVAAFAAAEGGQAGWDTYKSNTDVDMSWSGYSPCVPADKITISGKEHQTVDVVTDHAGSYKIDMHSNHHNVKGISEMGVEYVAPGGWTLHIDSRGDGVQTTYKYQNKCPLISKGKAPNWEYHVWRMVKVTADGTVTLEKYKEAAECRGDLKDDATPSASVVE